MFSRVIKQCWSSCALSVKLFRSMYFRRYSKEERSEGAQGGRGFGGSGGILVPATAFVPRARIGSFRTSSVTRRSSLLVCFLQPCVATDIISLVAWMYWYWTMCRGTKKRDPEMTTWGWQPTTTMYSARLSPFLPCVSCTQASFCVRVRGGRGR